MMETIRVDGMSLTFEQIEKIAKHKANVELTEDSKKRIIHCREYVDRVINEGRIVYGLTTGFGKFSTITIPLEQIDELQENLIISHATGVGKPFSREETRVIMLLRINVLAHGNSGIRLETLQTLIDMLNSGIHPVIPEKGSVGASGDLAPLSHLVLVLIGKGEAEYKGVVMSGPEAMKMAGIKPVVLKAKEGLALNNGTQVMTAVASLAYIKARYLTKMADVIASMSVDSLLGTPTAYAHQIHDLRPYGGQKESAANMWSILDKSPLRESHRECSNVQDAYSLRCTPQVHGAVRTALDYVESVLNVEINSVTDNPLIFPDEDKVLSGGNFHGEPVAFAADTLGFTVAELANISERRMEQVFNPALNRNLNAFLAPRPGIDSGFMIAQLTAASLVSENKVMSHPASVDSIPTSANQEDHVSMGTISAVKARNIIDNVAYVLSIELLAACQALDCREVSSALVIEKVKARVRESIPTLDRDRVMYPDIEKMKQLVDSGELLDIISQEIEIL